MAEKDSYRYNRQLLGLMAKLGLRRQDVYDAINEAHGVPQQGQSPIYSCNLSLSREDYSRWAQTIRRVAAERQATC